MRFLVLFRTFQSAFIALSESLSCGDTTDFVKYLHLILFQVHCYLKRLLFEIFLFNREKR